MSKTTDLINFLSVTVLRVLDIVELWSSLGTTLLEQKLALKDMQNVTLVIFIVFRYLKVRCHCYGHVFLAPEQQADTETSSQT